MNESVSRVFTIPAIAAVPILFVACGDGAPHQNGDFDTSSISDASDSGASFDGSDSSSIDDAFGGDTSIVDDAGSDIANDSTNEIDAPSDDVTMNPDVSGDVGEDDADTTDSSIQDDTPSDIAATDSNTDSVPDTMEAFDAIDVTDGSDSTDTAPETDADHTTDASADGDADDIGGPTAYERFFEAIDMTAFCREIVECGYYDYVGTCEEAYLRYASSILGYAYDVSPGGLTDACVDAAIAYIDCFSEESYCYYGEYFVDAYVECEPEKIAFNEICNVR